MKAGDSVIILVEIFNEGNWPDSIWQGGKNGVLIAYGWGATYLLMTRLT